MDTKSMLRIETHTPYLPSVEHQLDNGVVNFADFESVFCAEIVR